MTQGQIRLPVPLRLCASLFLAAAVASAARAPQAQGILLGVLEDLPGDYAEAPNFRALRVLFEKKDGEWRAFPSECADEGCLKTVSGKFPREVTWSIGLRGKVLGSVTGRTLTEFPLYSQIGLQEIVSQGEIPTVGERSQEFGGFLDAAVYRPLVANSQPYFKDAQGWSAASLPQEYVDLLRREFRRKYPSVQNCANPDENVARPWAYRDADIKVQKSYGARDRWMLGVVQLGPSRCDLEDSPAFEDQWFAIQPDGEARFLGVDMAFVDSGDYDNDGQPEVLFQISGYNLGGYALFYDNFRKQVFFRTSYH